MKDDERELLRRMLREGNLPGVVRKSPRRIAQEMGLNGKRASYICEKWAGKGWYDYGVADDLGWLTEQGMVVAAGAE